MKNLWASPIAGTFVQNSGIKKLPMSVSFVIEDNGKGLDLEEVMSRDISESGLGLTSIFERVKSLGGQIEIDSQFLKGTKISFTIPYKKEGVNQ